ncbi:MAG TPA: Imm74 family immunity protein [Rhizomicrobium sp.]|jgi:hypothetical protein
MGESFSVPRVNVVSSDRGYSVEVLGRVGIEYREGDKSVFVDSEVLTAGHGIMVIRRSIRSWKPPHEKEEMTEEQKNRIVENIRRAIGFRGEPIEVV